MTLSQKRQRAYKKGLWAERLAVAYFWLRGYRILSSRFKTHVGEIDILACKHKTLVAVEVKARKNLDDALASISTKSRKRIEKAAQYYVMQNPEFNNFHIRFDVFAFAPPFRMRHLDNAWQARS